MRLCLALIVGQDQTAKSVFIADGVRQGNHWTLLAVGVKEKLSYYGDSLRWDTPSNSIHMVEQLLSKLGIQFLNHTNLCSCNQKNQSIYIFSILLNICGVIVLFMAAIMCCNWQSWNVAPSCLSKPSFYSKTKCNTYILDF